MPTCLWCNFQKKTVGVCPNCGRISNDWSAKRAADPNYESPVYEIKRCRHCGTPISKGAAGQCRICYTGVRHPRVPDTKPHRKLWTRYGTYKTHEAARRAFYKWVCKNEFYGNLKWGEDRYGRFLYREQPKYSYGGFIRRGYPVFSAPRSLYRDYWERELEQHRQRMEKEAIKRHDEEAERLQFASAMKRLNKNTRFFRVLAGMSKMPTG